MNSTNKLLLALKDNEELQNYLADKSVGDRCVMEVTVMLDEKTNEQASFSVESVEAEEDAMPQMDSTEEPGEAEEPEGDGESENEGMLPKDGAAVLAVFKPKKKTGDDGGY